MRRFTGTQFVAYVNSDMKFDKYGDMIVNLRVPFDFKELAVPLSDVFGLPLSIDVQIWKPYEERLAEDRAAG